jgi:hypothetical protein
MSAIKDLRLLLLSPESVVLSLPSTTVLPCRTLLRSLRFDPWCLPLPASILLWLRSRRLRPLLRDLPNTLLGLRSFYSLRHLPLWHLPGALLRLWLWTRLLYVLRHLPATRLLLLRHWTLGLYGIHTLRRGLLPLRRIKNLLASTATSALRHRWRAAARTSASMASALAESRNSGT